MKLEITPGFEPPETASGQLTCAEGKQLYDTAAGRRVLELGAGSGRATVCLAQQAAEVVSVDIEDQSVAATWMWKYDRADRLTFHKGPPADVLATRTGRFDLILIDSAWGGDDLAGHLDLLTPKLAPGGTVAVHGYPDTSPTRTHFKRKPFTPRHRQRCKVAGCKLRSRCVDGYLRAAASGNVTSVVVSITPALATPQRVARTAMDYTYRRSDVINCVRRYWTAPRRDCR